VWAGWGCSGWWERLGTVHDHLSAGGVLTGEDEQSARQDHGLAGVDSESEATYRTSRVMIGQIDRWGPGSRVAGQMGCAPGL
jgi:hypothetical protein